MPKRYVVKRATPGTVRNGKFIPRSRAKNIAQGFHDAGGGFHPIRASADYDPSRVGESGGGSGKKRGKKKAAPKRKAAPKKKAAPKRKATKAKAAKKRSKPTMRAGKSTATRKRR